MGLKHALLPALLLASAGAGAQIPDPLKSNPFNNPGDWLTYSGQYHAQRHSMLKQITAANVGRIQAKWVYHMTGQMNLEAVPIVANGVMYVSQYNRIDALDARTGNVIWQFQRQPIATGAQRGTGFWNNKLYVTTSDKHLLALDARNGSVLWDVAVHDGLQPAGQAPLIAKGKLIVSGNQPHGFIQAYDADTGKYLWSWTPVPGADDPKALASWGGQKPDGMPIWVSGSYDPDLNLIYYGTGQPEPQWAGEGRPGDNLYGDCIVALDVDTGKLKWAYQNTPHDTHDYDSLEMPVLVNGMWKDKPRKMLLQANRNGFYYILDRTNGEFLQATQFVKRVDWLKGWDGGRPIPDPTHDPSIKGTTTCPSTAGATNWPSPTYDPQLHMFYFVAQEGCGINLRDTARNYAGTGYLESPEEGKTWQLFTRALDAFTGKKVWDYEQVTSHHYGPGLMSTAGGVLFSPEEFGQFTALDSKTGKVLWHFNTGDVITASPVSYSVDGKQFVAVVSSTNVFAFGLPDGGAK